MKYANIGSGEIGTALTLTEGSEICNILQSNRLGPRIFRRN
jgi:hypothetical protein